MARRLTPTTKPRSPAQQAAPATKPEEKRAARSRPSNVSDETLKTHYSIIIEAKLEEERAGELLKSARGILGAKIKDAQAAGVNTKAMKIVLGWRKRETAELDHEIRAINRIAFIANLPIGAQLGLFENGESVATALDSKSIATAEAPAQANAIASTSDLDDASAKGFAAGRAGHSANLNPHDDGSPLALRWEVARQHATVERANEVFARPSDDELAEDINAMNAIRVQPDGGRAS